MTRPAMGAKLGPTWQRRGWPRLRNNQGTLHLGTCTWEAETSLTFHLTTLFRPSSVLGCHLLGEAPPAAELVSGCVPLVFGDISHCGRGFPVDHPHHPPTHRRPRQDWELFADRLIPLITQYQLKERMSWLMNSFHLQTENRNHGYGGSGKAAFSRGSLGRYYQMPQILPRLSV